MYRRMLHTARRADIMHVNPQLLDRDPASHVFDAHYVYMTRWALELLLQAKPGQHVDVGSLIEFVAVASLITPVEYVDIRAPQGSFPRVEFREGDITKLPYSTASITSLSCLHVVEHVGLGRYGDNLDVLGTVSALGELARVLAVNGRLYVALPIGKEVTYFNAHRVTDPRSVESFLPGLSLISFSAVGDDGVYYPNASPGSFVDHRYACGLYVFTKRH